MDSLVKPTVYRTDVGELRAYGRVRGVPAPGLDVTDDLSPTAHRPPTRGAGTAARRLGVSCEAGGCYDREAR